MSESVDEILGDAEREYFGPLYDFEGDVPQGELKAFKAAWAARGEQPASIMWCGNLVKAIDVINGFESNVALAENENEILMTALECLVNKIELVSKSPEYESVWFVNQLHVGPYTGPTYKVEFDKAREALAKVGVLK